jgi:hypothetical protein
MDPRLIEARLLLESELSHSEIHDALRKALRALHSRAWCWLQEIYDTHVVYEVNPKPDPAMPDEAERPPARLFDVDYTVDDSGTVTLGTPVEVKRVVTYEPVSAPAAATESASDEFEFDFVPLLEKAVRADGTMPIKIIQPGWGSSGFYKPEVLERDGPQVFTRGLQLFADHPTPTEEAERPERSIKDLVATLSKDATWNANGLKGPGLYAEAKVIDSWKPFVEQLAPHIGLSIRAMGRAVSGEAEGRKGPIIEGIVSAKSVDLVTAAGAGGEIISMFESARKRVVETQPHSGGDSGMDETQLREAEAARDTALAEAKAAKEEAEALRTENARLHEREVLAEATRLAGEIVAGAEALHEITRTRLVKEAVAGLQVTDGALDVDALKASAQALVDAAVAEHAAITESGQVKGLGGAPAGGLRVDLVESFKAIGLNDEQAALAAKGR